MRYAIKVLKSNSREIACNWLDKLKTFVVVECPKRCIKPLFDKYEVTFYYSFGRL